ncbi:MAG: glycosyltransferase family 2 protein [Candidatus Brocadiaceae bacterium]|nr:glycosyltransferase family 2 protein [Candidatus Brocadiaceae bacterium]
MRDLRFIIVNWNTRKLLLDCIESIHATVKEFNFEVYVVDNGSEDDSVPMLRNHFPQVFVIENRENQGFAAAVNQALKDNTASYVVLLNTDAQLCDNTIQVMHAFMQQHTDVGIAGAQLLKPDGTKQNSFDNYPTLATEFLNKSLLRMIRPQKYRSKKQNITNPIEVESVIGACLMIRNEALKQVGTLDEAYFFFVEETDWCLRMQKTGWKVFHVPDAKVIHLGGESKKRAPWQSQIEYCRSLYIFFRKHRSYSAYITFRVCYLIKIYINLILNLIGNLCVLFRHTKLRYRLTTYSRLFLWHLLFCPEWMGLKPLKRKIKIKLFLD